MNNSGNVTIEVPTAHLNLSPFGFMHWARHYIKCHRDFKSPNDFSPVPYFLLCRAIELGLKARHLETLRQKEVKDKFGHDLLKALRALPPGNVNLTDHQIEVLSTASKIYKDKGFEYFSVVHAATGFKAFPDLAALEAITKEVVSDDG